MAALNLPMNRLSAKNKIIIIALAWLTVSFAMLFYFFGMLDVSNQQLVDSMAKDRTDLKNLQAQNQSYLQAKADLQKLQGEPLQPQNFFGQDITLVNELKILEALKQKFGVQAQISGISGTINNAAKATTVSPLVKVPYNISVVGDFNSVMGYVESLENLSFITQVTNVSLNAADKGQISLGLGATFYLRK